MLLTLFIGWLIRGHVNRLQRSFQRDSERFPGHYSLRSWGETPLVCVLRIASNVAYFSSSRGNDDALPVFVCKALRYQASSNTDYRAITKCVGSQLFWTKPLSTSLGDRQVIHFGEEMPSVLVVHRFIG